MNRPCTSEKSKGRFKTWSLFFCGLCMGAADLVPGISGGTIAFILGFYQPLIDSLKTLNADAFRTLFQGKFSAFKSMVDWKFLLPLLAGVLVAIFSLANFFQFILGHEVYRVYFYALFLGLISASFVFCMRQVKEWNLSIFAGLFLGAVIAFLLTENTPRVDIAGKYSIPLKIENKNIVIGQGESCHHLLTGLTTPMLSALLAKGLLEDSAPVYDEHNLCIGLAGELALSSEASLFSGWVVLSGALAICALLLPGISGSYILTLLGVYPLIIEAVADFAAGLTKASFNMEAFGILSSLGLGVVLGAIVFSRLVSSLLQKYPSQCLAILSGFMIGAIRSVWPFWSYEYFLIPLKLYKGPQLTAIDPFFPPLDSPLAWQAFAFTILGFFLVFAIEGIVKMRSNRLSGKRTLTG